MPKKPRGVVHSLQVSGGHQTVRQLALPESKEGIEQFFADLYSGLASDVGLTLTGVELNETDDLDFSAVLDGTPIYLELTEVLSPGHGAHEGRSNDYGVLELASALTSAVEKKAAKYGGEQGRPVVLLLYATDWRVAPVPQAIDVARFELRNDGHGFNRVEFVVPRTDGKGILQTLFPVERDWAGFDPDHFANQSVVIGNVTKPLPRHLWPDARGKSD